MDRVVHFEIPADDLERAKKFYGENFGLTSTQHVSDPTIIGFCRTSHSAAPTPSPG